MGIRASFFFPEFQKRFEAGACRMRRGFQHLRSPIEACTEARAAVNLFQRNGKPHEVSSSSARPWSWLGQNILLLLCVLTIVNKN